MPSGSWSPEEPAWALGSGVSLLGHQMLQVPCRGLLLWTGRIWMGELSAGLWEAQWYGRGRKYPTGS